MNVSPFEVAQPDDVTQEWWDATREHRYTVQACGACGHVQHPPKALCVHCGSMEHLSLADASGEGVVDTWTVVHRAPRPDIGTPYTIARIRLDEGPVVLSRLDGADWAIGERVAVHWLDLEDGRALPLFHRAR